MSLLSEVYATPSRVKGVVQLLAQEQGQSLKRATAEALLSPLTLQNTPEEGQSAAEERQASTRSMAKAVINECIKLGLLLADGDLVALNPELPRPVRQRESVRSALPAAILDLVLMPNSESHQLAAALAWYLGQDVLAAPGTWQEFGEALLAWGATDVLKFNDNTFQMFAYWSRYLGFAHQFIAPSRTSTEERRLGPDPTDCLRRVLDEVFGRRKVRLQGPQYLELVSERCPLFEGGVLRKAWERYSPPRESKQLSSTTSHALLRLEEEGTIGMEMRSDAEAVILVEGSKRRAISEISWLRNAEGGR